MTLLGWAQIALVLAAVVAAAIPLGQHVARVAQGGRTILHPILGPIERGLHALAGIDPSRGQGWQAYALAMLAFNAAGFAGAASGGRSPANAQGARPARQPRASGRARG